MKVYIIMLKNNDHDKVILVVKSKEEAKNIIHDVVEDLQGVCNFSKNFHHYIVEENLWGA